MSSTSTELTTKIPDITWYQNKERVFVSISMSEVTPGDNFSYNLRLSSNILQLISPVYHFKVTLYQPVSQITHSYNGRVLEVVLEKKTTDEATDPAFWEKLTQDTVFNKGHVRVNWARWVDESDDEYTAIPDMNDMADMPWENEGFQKYLQQHQDDTDSGSDGSEETSCRVSPDCTNGK